MDVLAQHQRLVVLGSPGAGKTVLALRLVCHLAAWASADGQGPVEIPVRLDLASAPLRTTGVDLDGASSASLAERFDEWLVHEVAENGTSRRTARALVARGWVIPVLDGLDEMDLGSAAAAVEALNQPVATQSSTRRLVLTSRTSRYEKLALNGAPERGDRPSWLDDAFAVQLMPLTPSDVRAELENRFGADIQRWQHVIGRLAARDTDDVLADDVLVTALCSPLRLYLALTAYRGSDTNSSELTTAETGPELDALLFARLIPEVTRQQPRPTGELYDRFDVERWLRAVARHLGNAVGFRAEQLWSTVAPRTCRVSATLLALILTVLVIISAGGLLVATPRLAELTGMLLLAVPVLAWMGFASDLRLDLWGLRRPAARRRLARGLLDGWLFAGVFNLVASIVKGIVDGGIAGSSVLTYLEATAVAGTAIGIVRGLDWSPPTTGFRSNVRQPIVAAAIVLAGCASIGAAWGVLSLGLDRVVLISRGAVVGLLIGLGIVGSSSWFRYLTSSLVLAVAGRRRPLPVRRAEFLDWALGAGLLRQSGQEIQFRHREFQDWLLDPRHVGAAGLL